MPGPDWTKEKQQIEASEKDYTGGQNIIATGTVSLREVFCNAIGWYLFSAGPVIYLAVTVTPLIYIPWVLGMLVTFWYSIAKFNYTHELALGVAVGPLPVLLGMYGVNAHPNISNGLLVSVLFAVVLSFIGLSLDEWPDAKANLKKGVKSVAYLVWKYSPELPLNTVENGQSTDKDLTVLQWYCTSWISLLFLYQIFLIVIGILKPLTGWTLILAPFLLAMLVIMRENFHKSMRIIIGIAAMYPVILVVTQVFGG